MGGIWGFLSRRMKSNVDTVPKIMFDIRTFPSLGASRTEKPSPVSYPGCCGHLGSVSHRS